MTNEFVGREMNDLDQSVMRVIVNNAGETISGVRMAKQCQEAVEEGHEAMMALFDVAPVVVFIRDDGWMLGASDIFESVAYDMWKDKWVGFCKCPHSIVADIADYIPSSF